MSYINFTRIAAQQKTNEELHNLHQLLLKELVKAKSKGHYMDIVRKFNKDHRTNFAIPQSVYDK